MLYALLSSSYGELVGTFGPAALGPSDPNCGACGPIFRLNVIVKHVLEKECVSEICISETCVSERMC